MAILVFFSVLCTIDASIFRPVLLAANDSLTWFRFPMSRICSSPALLTPYNWVSGRVEKGGALDGTQTEKSSSCMEQRRSGVCHFIFLTAFSWALFSRTIENVFSSSKFSTSPDKVCQPLVVYSTVCAPVSSARMIFQLRMIYGS